jgi:hypothetical protein
MMLRAVADGAAFLARFARARSGGIVPMAAAGVPLVAVLAIAATELASLSADKRLMQDAADAVALDGANQLTLASMDGVEERMEASAEAKLKDLAGRSKLEVNATIVQDGEALLVELVSRRTSFFGNMLPPGGFVTHAQSTAQKMRTVPLCVLAHSNAAETVLMGGSADLSAPKCLVHSNKEVAVTATAKLTALMVQAVDAATGAIFPDPMVGAEPLRDPFAAMIISPPTGRCHDDRGYWKADDQRLNPRPGLYCGPVVVGDGQTMTLSGGEYWFMGGLTLQGNAVLTGAGSTMFFGQDAKLEIKDQARVNLEGPRTGAWAGFLVVAHRDNRNDFLIAADHVDKLLGTVYVPSAKLIIDGDSEVAEGSDWTIVVAKALEVRGSSRLVVNADYARSGVPAPEGVGDKYHAGRSVRLLR